jgi:O-methyltransferase involved in polyketide biosynthesis
MNMPSRTGQAVALTRAGLDRPHSRDGDPGAQRALCEGMAFTPPGWLRPGIEARTRFVDGQVTAALASGVQQIVICGAGYDDRALRFRTEGVRFFELDHPATQADKAARLRAVGAEGVRFLELDNPATQADNAGLRAVGAEGVRFLELDHPATQADKAGRLRAMGAEGEGLIVVAADFGTDDVAAVLDRAGHDRGCPSLFICEGLLVYLDQPTCHRLLAGLAARAQAASVLAVSLSTHAAGLDSAAVAAAANARRRTGEAEPWRTILPADEYLALVADSGWAVTSVAESPSPVVEVSDGRQSLFVTAVRAALDG